MQPTIQNDSKVKTTEKHTESNRAPTSAPSMQSPSTPEDQFLFYLIDLSSVPFCKKEKNYIYIHLPLCSFLKKYLY